MTLYDNNTYSFDDCSIFNLCEINIPNSWSEMFGTNRLRSYNYGKLVRLMASLNQQNIIPYRFIPESEKFNSNLIKHANQLLIKTKINPAFMDLVFKKEVIESLKFSFKGVLKVFNTIQKNDNFQNIKQFFEQNCQVPTNVPNNDDCKIIGGLNSFNCLGNKFFISADNHFRNNCDLIKQEWNITIVPEHECHLLC
ncbi:hypothetical protein GOV04_03035 [Candidatus Woesearchaeota archaeon]|nr:hypothetical protein [Candidatus Woesearchaeota archaeon]